VANRFVRRIKSGDIESVDELKSEFKALAKKSHPDLAGEGAEGADFVALRAEYEAALRDFQKHRFGVAVRSPNAPESRAGSGGMSDEAWARLAILLKRGFPKVPRHEKEALRYDYAKWLLSGALGAELGEELAACEAELLAAQAAHGATLEAELALLGDLIDFSERRLSPMRTQIVLSLGSLFADPAVGPAFRAFSRGLARELGIGMELG
jgi:hypothetical protein